jgi:hypothetical protein
VLRDDNARLQAERHHLFAALNALDATVIGRCMQRHRDQEFIRSLNAVEAEVPPGKMVHAIVDNMADTSTEGGAVAGTSSTLEFHFNLRVLAQRRRRLAGPTADEAGRIPLIAAVSRGHQALD